MFRRIILLLINLFSFFISDLPSTAPVVYAYQRSSHLIFLNILYNSHKCKCDCEKTDIIDSRKKLVELFRSLTRFSFCVFFSVQTNKIIFIISRLDCSGESYLFIAPYISNVLWIINV